MGDWVLRYYSPAKKCKLDSAWVGPYLVVSLAGWALGTQRHPDSPPILVHCQDLKKIPRPSGLMSWIEAPRPEGSPMIPVLGASTMVLRDGVKSAIRLGHSRKADERILTDTDISWGIRWLSCFR